MFPGSTLTCVDSFDVGDSDRYADYQEELPFVEQRFDSNLAEFNGRVRKLKGASVPTLWSLGTANELFDLIYIDGSHERDDVLLDSLLSWRVLAPGGVIMWDDYKGAAGLPDERRPQGAVDAFLRMHPMRVLHRRYQMIALRD